MGVHSVIVPFVWPRWRSAVCGETEVVVQGPSFVRWEARSAPVEVSVYLR